MSKRLGLPLALLRGCAVGAVAVSAADKRALHRRLHPAGIYRPAPGRHGRDWRWRRHRVRRLRHGDVHEIPAERAVLLSHRRRGPARAAPHRRHDRRRRRCSCRRTAGSSAPKVRCSGPTMRRRRSRGSSRWPIARRSRRRCRRWSGSGRALYMPFRGRVARRRHSGSRALARHVDGSGSVGSAADQGRGVQRRR